MRRPPFRSTAPQRVTQGFLKIGADVSRAAADLFAAAQNLHGTRRTINAVDRLVQTIAAQRDKRCAPLDETVALVDARLEQNRKKA